MRVSTFDGLLCRLLIRWPERLENGWLRLPEHWDPGRADPHFHDEVCAELPRHSDTDIALGLKRYVLKKACVADWYQHLLELENIEIDWLEGEPRLPSGAVARWEYLCNFLDADTLLAFDFARKHGADEHIEDRISRWRTIARCTDYDLDTLLARGVSDLHIHAGGMRIPQAAWLDLMNNPRGAARYQSLDSAYRAHGGRVGSSLQEAMQRAYEARKALGTALFSAPLQQELGPSRDRWWAWDASAMRQERVLLIKAWQRARWDDYVLQLLDRYAHEKHRFAELSRQQAFVGETGLRRFSRNYFPRMKRKSATEEHRGSHRFTMQPTGDACAYLLESRCLERAELRLAPMERAADYWKFFKLWRRLEAQILERTKELGRNEITVRFAIHFKRTRDRSVKPNDRTPLRTKVREVERASAALRAALACPHRGHLLAPIARIDVAGDERDMGCAHFGPYLRLLRGDALAADGLENLFDGEGALPEHAAAFSRWARLRERGLHRFSPTDRRLGLTIHAGEDFADRLDGLYQVASAVDACGLRSGDAIGHGLALAWRRKHDRRSGIGGKFIRAGPAFDSLCWLLDSLEQDASESTRPDREALERTIVTSAGEFFPAFRRDIRHTDAMALWRAWRDPLNAPHELDSDLAKRLWRESIVSEDVDAKREEIVSIKERARFDDVVDIAGDRLLKKLTQERIVIEMNPSSNLRISGAVKPSDSPTLGIFKAVAKGLLACVNTDNPGVFVTCIENEFAMLLESARGKMDEGKIRDLLERVRRVGMEQVNWR